MYSAGTLGTWVPYISLGEEEVGAEVSELGRGGVEEGHGVDTGEAGVLGALDTYDRGHVGECGRDRVRSQWFRGFEGYRHHGHRPPEPSS